MAPDPATDAQEAVDEKLTEWAGHDTELDAYQLEDVLQLGRQVI